MCNHPKGNTAPRKRRASRLAKSAIRLGKDGDEGGCAISCFVLGVYDGIQ